MMVNLFPMRVAVAVVCLVVASPALASDPMVEGARQCTQQFPVQERANGIPMHLLAAISSTESGRWHDQLGLALPWPWTINVEGKGYYFDSKAEAVAKTAAFIRGGARSIDVGCMQVNLKHHPKAFRSLEEAFDPATNVAYGAKFLRGNYDDLGDWVKATAAYHSRTNQRGKEYLARIEKSWNRIVGKVQQARARQGMTAASIDSPNFDVASLGPETAAAVPGKSMRPIASTRMKVIQVTDQMRTSNQDVLVIRNADTMTAPVKVAAAASPAMPDMMVQGGAASAPHRVSIDNGGNSANMGGSSTRFVFAN